MGCALAIVHHRTRSPVPGTFAAASFLAQARQFTLAHPVCPRAVALAGGCARATCTSGWQNTCLEARAGGTHALSLCVAAGGTGRNDVARGVLERELQPRRSL